MARQKLTERNSVTTSTSDSYRHIVEGNVSYKIKKSDDLKGVVSGFVGSVASADLAPTADGIYICEDSGTYTNYGSVVVDLTNYLTFISVEDTQTTFNKIEIEPGVYNKIYRIGSAKNGSAFFDDFDRTDRALNSDVSLSGETWATSGTGSATAVIEDNILISNGTIPHANSNFYASADVNETVNSVIGSYSFREGEESTCPTLIITETKGALTNMWHLQIQREGWQLDKWIAGASTLNLTNGTFHHKSDVVYGIGLEIDYVTNTVKILCPDGSVVEYVDADVATFTPVAVTIQCFNGKGRWHGITTQKTKNKGINALGLSAPIGMVSPLYGYGINQVNTYRRETLNGAGWYRIIERGTLSSYQISGNLYLTAKSSVGATVAEIKIHGESSSNTMVLSSVNIGNTGTVPIDKVRYSVGASNELYLDVYVSETTNDVDLVWDFRGIGDVNEVVESSPTVGSTYEQTLSLDEIVENPFKNGFAFFKVQNIYTEILTASGTGWYRILTEDTFTTNWLGGTVKISAKNSAQAQNWEFEVSMTSSQDPRIEYIQGYSNTGKIFDQARLSRDGAGNIALDINLFTVASDVDLYVEFEGVGTLQSATSGATSLATKENTVSWINGTTKAETFTMTNAGTSNVESATKLVVNSNGATIASHTIAVDGTGMKAGDNFKIATKGTITALTLTVSGFTIINTPSTITANDVMLVDVISSSEILIKA